MSACYTVLCKPDSSGRLRRDNEGFATFLPRQRLAPDAHTRAFPRSSTSDSSKPQILSSLTNLIISGALHCHCLHLTGSQTHAESSERYKAASATDLGSAGTLCSSCSCSAVLENRPVLFCHMIHRSRDSPVTERERPSQHFTFQSQQEALE